MQCNDVARLMQFQFTSAPKKLSVQRLLRVKFKRM